MDGSEDGAILQQRAPVVAVCANTAHTSRLNASSLQPSPPPMVWFMLCVVTTTARVWGSLLTLTLAEMVVVCVCVCWDRGEGAQWCIRRWPRAAKERRTHLYVRLRVAGSQPDLPT